MNLQQLTNDELFLRFNELDHTNYLLKDRSEKVLLAYVNLVDLPGFQEDANNSRQTIIDFIQEQEELQQPKFKRRIEGGRRSKSRRSKSRRSKSRKSRRSRK
jgi:hypothetical protein